MIKVSQVFGPTIQGEGSAAGRHCVFVRVFNCNLECSWCDTAYTWAVTPEKAARTASGVEYSRTDPKLGEKQMSPEDVIEELLKVWDVRNRPTIVVISGGEPLMQQAELIPLMSRLRNWGNEIHIETAGTIAPSFEFDVRVNQYNVSPKLEHSGNLLSKRYRPETLKLFLSKGWFKFVVTTTGLEAQLDEIDKIVREVGLVPRRVMLMPEGSDVATNIHTAQAVVDEALRRGFGLSFRTHVLLWGDDVDK